MQPGFDVTTTSGVRVGDVRGLAAPELGGHLRLHQVEDAGAAAADLALGERHDA